MRLYSRPGNDLTQRFPLIVEALARLRARSCILDGEVVSCGDDGIAVFDRIRYKRYDGTGFLYALSNENHEGGRFCGCAHAGQMVRKHGESRENGQCVGSDAGRDLLMPARAGYMARWAMSLNAIGKRMPGSPRRPRHGRSGKRCGANTLAQSFGDWPWRAASLEQLGRCRIMSSARTDF